ncbi:MAG: hypothetical protein ACKO2L_10460, partial [Planctomycetaceae bacterium]
GLPPNRCSAAWRKPAGKRPLSTPQQRTRKRAPSVRNAAGGFRPTADQPHGGSLRANGPCKRPNNALASERTFGAKRSRGLPPNRCSAAWRKPAGKRPCQRPSNALTGARTCGAKRSRELPPYRYGS